MDINWAPGHSSIAENEEADRLAKEAAQEACTFKEGSTSTSMADVKQASHTHIMTLWQRRWTIAEVGREYYRYIPSITTKKYLDNQQDNPTVGYYNYKLVTTSSINTDPS